MFRHNLRSYFFCTIILILTGCGNDKKDAEQYRRFDEALQTANTTIGTAALNQFQVVQMKMHERGYAERVADRFFKTVAIKTEAEHISELIDTLRNTITREAYNIDVYAGSNAVVKKHLLENGMAKKLWTQLLQLRGLKDSLVTERLAINKVLKLSIDSIRNEAAFIDIFFKDASTGKALVSLAELDHDVKEIAYFSINFMSISLGEASIAYSTIDANVVIKQNTYQVQTGEKIKVSADISDFTIRSQPEVYINNSLAAAGKDGIAIMEIKATGTGPQSLPVTIHFKRDNGKTDSINRVVLYNVTISDKQ